MSKIDRRVLKTKNAINKAFIELLSERDFDDITINAISERANVNRGTIYLHYTDKFDLLNKCIEDHLNNMSEFCTLEKQGEERFDVFHSLLPMFQYFEEHYLFYSSMLSNKGTSRFHDKMMSMTINEMNERIKMGDINQGLNKEVVVQYMASAFVGVVEWWIKNNMPHSPQFMAQQLWSIFESSNFPVHEWWSSNDSNEQ
ncbi:TetR/AcrR family transcriptional regulator [Bacillus paramycoides]|uniref:TetR/AcrR family transcriptional regulator n=1 Tax=Bacillus paramycoides TaxID=2026194 RepID=UPI00381B8EE3